MKTILFVDDEIQILKAFKRVFIESDANILTANTGQEALQILRENEVDLVVSDMRMPNMDGYELLTRVKSLYPEVLRVILSGYSDERVVFKALQKNIAKVYLFKPWDNQVLLDTISHIFRSQDLLRDHDMLSLINGIEHLPTIPATYTEILRLIELDYSISEISENIERDPAIASKILRIANSAYYSAKTGSIQQAITTIGLRSTRELVLATAVYESLSNSKRQEESLLKVWEYSYLVNKMVAFIYKAVLNKKMASIHHSAGLLHNLGMVFLLVYFGDTYINVLTEAKSFKEMVVLEKDNYKTTHSEAGGYLLDWWGFPFSIVEAALYHHDPLNSNIINSEIVKVIYLAQYYGSKIMEIEHDDELNLQVFMDLGITKEFCDEKMEKFKVGGKYV